MRQPGSLRACGARCSGSNPDPGPIHSVKIALVLCGKYFFKQIQYFVFMFSYNLQELFSLICQFVYSFLSLHIPSMKFLVSSECSVLQIVPGLMNIPNLSFTSPVISYPLRLFLSSSVSMSMSMNERKILSLNGFDIGQGKFE